MKWKYRPSRLILLVLLLLTVALAYWLTDTSAARTGQLNLSYTLCLEAEAGYQLLEKDSLARLHYAQAYWADTTGQYYSKALRSPSGDTLLLSVFNQASLTKAQELLRAAGFETIQEERIAPAGFAGLIALARAADSTFFLRRLIAEPQFQVVIMADQVSRDSAALHRAFQDDRFIQSLVKCW